MQDKNVMLCHRSEWKYITKELVWYLIDKYQMLPDAMVTRLLCKALQRKEKSFIFLSKLYLSQQHDLMGRHIKMSFMTHTTRTQQYSVHYSRKLKEEFEENSIQQGSYEINPRSRITLALPISHLPSASNVTLLDLLPILIPPV